MGIRANAFGTAFTLLALGGCGPLRVPADHPDAPALHARPANSTTLIEIRTIVVAWTDAEDAPPDLERTEEQARERAATLASLARQPDTAFGELARQYADNDLERIRLERGAGRVDGAIERAAFRLDVGGTSRPIRTAEGYVVIERLADPIPGPATVGARHILIAHNESQRLGDGIDRTKEEARALAEEVARRAQAGENWNALHAEFSDEPNGSEGGDLGEFGRGQMVPAFERAAFAMAVGGISDVVESPFGFHIITRYR